MTVYYISLGVDTFAPVRPDQIKEVSSKVLLKDGSSQEHVLRLLRSRVAPGQFNPNTTRLRVETDKGELLYLLDNEGRCQEWRDGKPVEERTITPRSFLLLDAYLEARAARQKKKKP